MKSLFSLAITFLLSLLYALPVQAETALIAAASNVQFAFNELIHDFSRAHPEVSVKISFGSSGNFHSQIIYGAPYDIFFSADLGYPLKLERAGFAAPNNQTTSYASGKIFLWVANDMGINVHAKKFKTLVDPKMGKIAIANPRHAPYGRAAVESMKHFSIYEKIKNKLVIGENISQAAQFTDSGAAQAGILSLSLIAGGKMKNSGTYWEIPTKSHQPIAQGFLILKNGKNIQAAKTFSKFVLSSKGQRVLRHYGYEVPTE